MFAPSIDILLRHAEEPCASAAHGLVDPSVEIGLVRGDPGFGLLALISLLVLSAYHQLVLCDAIRERHAHEGQEFGRGGICRTPGRTQANKICRRIPADVARIMAAGAPTVGLDLASKRGF